MKFILNLSKFAVGVSMYQGFLSEKLVVTRPPNENSDLFLLFFHITVFTFQHTKPVKENWTAGPPSPPSTVTGW